MKTNFSFLAATLCALSPLFPQAPDIQWQNTIGGNTYDYLRFLQQTADGGYILGGESISDSSGDKTENSLGASDIWVVKLDTIGTIQWQNTIGGFDGDGLNSLQQTADGGYILGGGSSSGVSGDKTENSLGSYDYWVVKLDATGAIQWQNTIGGNQPDILRSIKQTADGGYILGGSSRSNLTGDKTENSLGGLNDFWIIKLDSTGTIQWQNTIGGNNYDELWSLQLTSDGGYIVGGFSNSDISSDKTENSLGSHDYWVVKLDASGNIQWQNTIGGNSDDQLSCLQQTADGGYILGGYSDSNISGDKTENCLGLYDYWVVKLDTAGAIQWQKTIGGDSYDYLYSLQQAADGGYVIGGTSRSDTSGNKTANNFGEYDYWMLKLNAAGAVQWQATFGGNTFDHLYSLQQTADGGYVIGGYSDSSISGNKSENSMGAGDYWVIKLAPETVPAREVPAAPASVTIYPNPAAETVFVRAGAKTTLSLCDAIGQSISTQTFQGNGKIDLSLLPNGIYFLVETETGVWHKILKNK